MNIDLALCGKVGVSSAMVYSVIVREVDIRGVLFEGHPYVCLSITSIQNVLSFYSKKTIQRALDNLEENGLIESKLFIGTTKWRRIV